MRLKIGHFHDKFGIKVDARVVYGAGISSVLLVGRPIPQLRIEEIRPRRRIAADPKRMIHIGKLIEAELRRQERSVAWFARSLPCERTNVYDIFKRRSIDTEMLLRISVVLRHDFFRYYTEETADRQENSTLP